MTHLKFSFLQADSASCKQVKKKLQVLSRSLRLLISVCSVYLTSLSRALDIPPPPETLQHGLMSADSQHSLMSVVSDTGLPPLTQTVSMDLVNYTLGGLGRQ